MIVYFDDIWIGRGWFGIRMGALIIPSMRVLFVLPCKVSHACPKVRWSQAIATYQPASSKCQSMPTMNNTHSAYYPSRTGRANCWSKPSLGSTIDRHSDRMATWFDIFLSPLLTVRASSISLVCWIKVFAVGFIATQDRQPSRWVWKRQYPAIIGGVIIIRVRHLISKVVEPITCMERLAAT